MYYTANSQNIFLLWVYTKYLKTIPQIKFIIGVIFMLYFSALFNYILQYDLNILYISQMLVLIDVIVMTLNQLDLEHNIYDPNKNITLYHLNIVHILVKSVFISIMKGITIFTLIAIIYLMNYTASYFNFNFDFNYAIIPIILYYMKYILENLCDVSFIKKIFPKYIINNVISTTEPKKLKEIKKINNE